MTDDDRPDLAAELRAALADGLDVAGTVEEAEILTSVGRVGVDMVIEASDLDGPAQRQAYAVLCDLLAGRLAGSADQVLGCLIFATEPDPAALAAGLDGMLRGGMIRGGGGVTFTPVIPLSREQAEGLASAGTSLDQLVDPATDLIAIAADRRPPTVETARTLLAELAELIDRATD